MSTVRPGQHEVKTQSDGSNAVRWRLWVAMLALALVPTIAAAYLITSLLSEPDATLAAGRSRESSASAAALLAREQAIGERLQIVAADPQVARLANGIESNSDRQLATRVLKSLRGDDGAIVASACVVRVADGQSVPLSSARTGACADGSLPRRAIAMSDSITRTTSGEGAAQRLLIATPLRSDAGQVSAVLSAEVDVAKLFDRTRMLGGDTVSSMLVDMGSSEVVATAAASVGPVDGADPVDPAAVAPYLSGVVSHTDDADADLRAMGLLSTVVPLWSNGDGTRMSLVQLWPDTSGGMPLGIRLALVIMLAGAIVAVIVLVRYFLNPFRELATSRDELQTLYHEAREDRARGWAHRPRQPPRLPGGAGAPDPHLRRARYAVQPGAHGPRRPQGRERPRGPRRRRRDAGHDGSHDA